MKDILILGIETSCDETAASVVANGRKVLSNIISSQVDLHKKYGGVVPEIASRKHVELVIPVIDNALKEAGVTDQVDAIAVTHGPGLVGASWWASPPQRQLLFHCKPLVSVNHIEGHIAANYISHPDLEPGIYAWWYRADTAILACAESYTEFRIMGRTRDDAAGRPSTRSPGYWAGISRRTSHREGGKGGKPGSLRFPEG